MTTSPSPPSSKNLSPTRLGKSKEHAVDIADESVAGEEDPGAALDIPPAPSSTAAKPAPNAKK